MLDNYGIVARARAGSNHTKVLLARGVGDGRQMMGSAPCFPNTLHLTGLTRCATQTPLACGSTVRPISSVVRFSLFERKTNHKRKIQYRCE
jgi:hypothetical protein